MDVQIGKILGSGYDDDGFLTVQIATFSSSSAKTIGNVFLYNQHGIQQRPLDPDADGTACQCLYWSEGNKYYAIPLNDPRTQTGVSIQLQKGETIIHSPSGVGFIRMHADGAISTFTTDDNTSNGRSVAFRVAPTGLSFQSPFGRMTFDATGYHVVHNSGARLDLGAIQAPAPLNAFGIGSYATISAAITHVEGAAVALGTRTGAPDPLAKSTPTLVAFQSLTTALDAVAAALTAIAGVPVVTSAGAGPAAAAATAIALAQTAIAAAANTIPSLAAGAT